MAGRSLALGIALGGRRAVAVVLGRKGATSAEVPLNLPEGKADAGELVRVLTELKGKLEGAGLGSTDGATVRVTLLPPLADARVVSLPPLRRAELEAVVRRDASRYFLGGNGPKVFSIRPPAGAGRSGGDDPGAAEQGGGRDILVAAAPHALLEGVRAAIEQIGWHAVSFEAAHGAWLSAAEATKGPPLGAVVATVDDTVCLIRLAGSDPTSVRQLPLGDLEGVRTALGDGPGRLLVLAAPEIADRLAAALSPAGWIAVRDPAGWITAEESAGARGDAGVLELLPPSIAAERRARAKRLSGRLVAASILLLVAAAAAQFWGVQRELAAVRASRAELQSQVAPLIADRDSLNRLSDRLGEIEALADEATFFTPALVELAVLLPRDTHITGLFASGDTVEIEGAGERAGEAILALQRSGLFSDLRQQSPVERDLQDGETVVQRFRVRGILAPAGAGGREGRDPPRGDSPRGDSPRGDSP